MGSFPPNAIGLHDMIGNVSEWVSSCFIEGKGLLPEDESDDRCEARYQVTGGGAYYHSGLVAKWTIYDRKEYYNDYKSSDHIGFRLAKDFELRAEPAEKTGDVVE